MFSIGELARRTDVKIATIRYYEQIGLIDAPERSEGNQRRYTRVGLERLSFIRHARELGLSIEAIRELIDLGGHPEKPCANAHHIASEYLSAIRKRIAKLKRLEAELKRIEAGCDAGNIGDCYVIEALADHSLCKAEH